ncbi:sperm-associated antigen 1 isoform X2 [Phascolarctos cinereus]|uniref:Sperm-associated antigen 1 n=1 Tax=Phascolarctos cinereus TaxID=38626 RepID=A0A6P5ISC0_PHACI|nr:sperm-associated antigen 1 [Phascolarctos cinereus]XP_020824974.1 sperm-associated antigen 1 [Phascolarctos cinereus]
MTDQTPSLWSFGTTKTFQIPIEHLDFKFVEKCSDVKHLEKILVVLRSGEEGFYPELIECCEKRIQSLCPESRILRKEKPAATASSFTREEWEKIDGDIKSWVSEIKKEDSKVHFHEMDTFQELEGHLPPVRGTNSPLNTGKEKDNKSRSSQKKKVPRDYAEWDKFDVEKECSKIDEDYKENTTPNISSHSLKIEKNIGTIGLSDKERDFLATREKEKGNEAFSSGDYEEAVTYYTRSISVSPTVVAYNNRAQAEIKLKNWNNALQDCEKVLELEPGNLKAFMRRATAYKHQNKYREAIEDLKKVLNIEPDNVIAKKILSEVEKDLNKSQPESAPKTKGKRMVIQEIEDSEDEDGKRSGEHENGSGDKKTDVPVRGEQRSDQPEMGNVQNKFTGKGNGKKSRGKQAQKCRDRAVSGATSQGQNSKPSPRLGGEVNGHLESDKKTAGGSGGAKEVARPGPAPSPLPLPAATAADLKSQGNELFRNGQFGEAVLKYSQAVEKLQGLGSESADELSVLYSNRAACYLKEGNCSGCVEDCNRALELHPFSIKPLLRRAVAYETMEQYRKAYVDYKTILQIDNRIQAANDSINRITRTLIDQDGPTWREKLSPIPAVPFSVQLHRLDGGSPAARPTQDGTTESGPHQKSQVTGTKREEMFTTLKEEGNEFVTKGKYKEALDKYSECLEINHSECVIYTNRALCYLKLCQFEEAKQDCDRALEIEEANVKAFYRRGLAHKALKNYQESFNDLNKVLLIDPNVSEAKKELKEITVFLNNKDDTPLPSQEKERRKIEIEEVVESSEEQPQGGSPENVSVTCHDLEKGPAGSRSLAMGLEKLRISKPANAYEFGQILNAINTRKDEEACAELLAITDPKDLPALLSNKLEGDTFLLLISSLKNHLLDNDPELVYQHLLHLSKAERFMMMLTLLSKGQKEQTEQLLEALSDKSNHAFTSEDVQNLKKHYEL